MKSKIMPEKHLFPPAPHFHLCLSPREMGSGVYAQFVTCYFCCCSGERIFHCSTVVPHRVTGPNRKLAPARVVLLNIFSPHSSLDKIISAIFPS